MIRGALPEWLQGFGARLKQEWNGSLTPVPYRIAMMLFRLEKMELELERKSPVSGRIRVGRSLSER